MVEPPVKPIEWLEESIRIVDQRELPLREVYIELKSADEVAHAIRTMALRGAPLIGVAAAMGVAIEARYSLDLKERDFRARIDRAMSLLRATRPTAKNLFWALSRMEGCIEETGTTEEITDRLRAEALKIYQEDLETGRRMGEIGASLIREGSVLLTHCNAGGLATTGFGTALAPMYVAHSKGVGFKVYADETRPLLQGSRLTAWELSRAGIGVTVICDSAAHGLLRDGMIDAVFVGADRITLSGDFANKVGTYGIALSAHENGVPFYVVAPTSTIDFEILSGSEIPIEQREPEEVTMIGGTRFVPEGVDAYNPAFDVTPASLVTGLITEEGLIEKEFESKLKLILSARKGVDNGKI